MSIKSNDTGSRPLKRRQNERQEKSRSANQPPLALASVTSYRRPQRALIASTAIAILLSQGLLRFDAANADQNSNSISETNSALLYQAPLPDQLPEPDAYSAVKPVPAPVAEGEIDTTGLKLGVGDQIKVKVYEREDLSGLSVIGADGKITIPMLGTFTAAGRVPKILERDIQTALTSMTAKATFVTVDVAEWRKVSVVGIVDKPGMYAFVPGMAPVHVLAAAGGVFRPAATANHVIDAAREAGSLRRASEQLAEAMARELRLEREIDGKGDIGEPPRRMIELVGAIHAQQLIENESRILARRNSIFQKTSAALDEEVSLAKQEVDAVKAQYAELEKKANLARMEMAEIDSFTKKGLTNRTRQLGVKRDSAASDGELQSQRATVVRAEKVLATAERDRLIIVANRSLKLEEDLKSVRDDIGRLGTDIVVSNEILGRYGGTGFGSTAQAGSVEYTVTRFVDGAYKTLAVSETTAIEPGDLLRVEFANRIDTSAGWAVSEGRGAAPAR